MKILLTRIWHLLWGFRLLITVVIIAICAWFVYGKISDFIRVTDKEKAALQLELKKTRPLATINGQLVQEIQQVKKVTSKQIADASDSIFKLKDKERKLIKENQRLAVIAQTVSLGDTIIAGYDADVHPDITGLSCDSLKELFEYAIVTPADFDYVTDSITLAGTVQMDGVAVHTIEIPDTLYERDVRKKTGFLNLGRQQFTQIYHTNPMFKSDAATVFTVNKTPNWWYKTGKPVLAGTVSSIITYFLVTSIINSK